MILILHFFLPLLILTKYVASLVVIKKKKYFSHSASLYIQDVNKNFFVILVITKMGLVNTKCLTRFSFPLYLPCPKTQIKRDSEFIFFLKINFCCPYSPFCVLPIWGSAIRVGCSVLLNFVFDICVIITLFNYYFIIIILCVCEVCEVILSVCLSSVLGPLGIACCFSGWKL